MPSSINSETPPANEAEEKNKLIYLLVETMKTKTKQRIVVFESFDID